MTNCKESDWKLFRVKIAEWQERYMDKVNKKLIKLLSDEKLLPSEKFWKAEKLIFHEKKIRRCNCRNESQHVQNKSLKTA